MLTKDPSQTHPSVRARLRTELEAELHRLLGVWFPRSLDRQHGGFLCDFDHRWKPAGPQEKMLEYQARQTIAAARGAVHFPDLVPLREAAGHGFRYLKDRLWDHEMGGWYRLLDRAGSPLNGGTKHGHGFAYSISACVAYYELTRDAECTTLAQAAFRWLEEHAHDDKHGGYFGFYRRDGTPILSRNQAPDPGGYYDSVGTPIGFKDANTTSDLLKGFGDLYRVWPDALLRARVEELLRIVRDRLVVAPGLLHMYAHPDWTPLPDVVRYAQVIRSANNLLSGAEAFTGAADLTSLRAFRSMVDAMLVAAWDREKGGFHAAGSAFGPAQIEATVVFVRTKCWWMQADGLKALMAAARYHPSEAAQYGALFVRLWEYVKRYLIDAKRGGWLFEGLDTDPRALRRPKASMWRDCSHEVEGLLDSLAMPDSL